MPAIEFARTYLEFLNTKDLNRCEKEFLRIPCPIEPLSKGIHINFEAQRIKSFTISPGMN